MSAFLNISQTGTTNLQSVGPGIAEALIIALAGSTYSQIATFALVILALAIRPTGLFGHAEVKKV